MLFICDKSVLFICDKSVLFICDKCELHVDNLLLVLTVWKEEQKRKLG